MVLHFQNHLTLTLWYSYKSNTYFYANPEHPGYRGITQRQIGGDAFQEQFCIVLVFLPTFGIMDYFSIRNSPLLLISPYKF